MVKDWNWFWKKIKERPECRQKINHLIKEGKSFNDIRKGCKEGKHDDDIRKQAFKMEMERLYEYKKSLVKNKGWVELPNGRIVHPDDAKGLR